MRGDVGPLYTAVPAGLWYIANILILNNFFLWHEFCLRECA